MITKRQRREFRQRMHYYEPCARFMDGGSLYGRSRHSPHRAGRIGRIFRTCIHLNFASDCFWFYNTANAHAYNNHTLYPLFAYQLRPRGTRSVPPPPHKIVPVDMGAIEREWAEAA